MAMSIFFSEGNGVVDDQFALSLSLGDVNGGTIAVNGTVTAMGLSQVSVNASVSIPSAPGSGNVYYNLQVDPINGAVTMYQSTVSQPAPTVASNGVTLKRIIYNTVINSTSTDPALNAGTTPDNPVGLP